MTDATRKRLESTAQPVSEKVMKKGLAFLGDMSGSFGQLDLKGVIHIVGKKCQQTGKQTDNGMQGTDGSK